MSLFNEHYEFQGYMRDPTRENLISARVYLAEQPKGAKFDAMKQALEKAESRRKMQAETWIRRAERLLTSPSIQNCADATRHLDTARAIFPDHPHITPLLFRALEFGSTL